MTSGNTRSCGCLAVESKKARRLENDAGVINHLILQYRRHAGSRNILFDLRREDFERLVRQPCFYCGEPRGNLKKTKNCKEGFAHNGIDRKDSRKGYTTENCVPCCGRCNRAKRDTPQADFISWIQRASKHLEAMARQWGTANAQAMPRRPARGVEQTKPANGAALASADGSTSEPSKEMK